MRSDDRVEHYLREDLGSAKAELARAIAERERLIAEQDAIVTDRMREMISLSELLTYYIRLDGLPPTPNPALLVDECGNCHEETRRTDESSPWMHPNGPACWPGYKNSPEAVPLSLMTPIDRAGVPGITQCPGCLAVTPGPHTPGCLVEMSERQAAMEKAALNGAQPAVGAGQ